MKKLSNNYRSFTIEELKKAAISIEAEIAKLQVESHFKAPKDTNQKSKGRRKLAVIKTFIKEQELRVELNKS
jgi:ribosomal protein L29